MVIDVSTVIAITSAAIAGGVVTSIMSKLWMDKKDSASVSAALINSLFDQHEKLLTRVGAQEKQIEAMHQELIRERESNASSKSVQTEMGLAIEQYKSRQAKMVAEITELKRRLSKHEKNTI